MISYAQNFEDIMLWRALKHVKDGFYIDIGAQDPVIDSVSMAFYEQGWRGVHVEPVWHYAEKIRKERPDETVIQAVIGGGSGVRSFYEIADTGLSTGDSQIAESHSKEGFSMREVIVPCISLKDVLNKYQQQDIHWLKIDVEGMEEEVLQSWIPSEVRPWIVVVESTLPNTQIETHKKWEPLIISLGYDFVYFDGLSRFYISKKQEELRSFFNSPPNIFDGATLKGTASGPFCYLLNSEITNLRQELREQTDSAMKQAERYGEALAVKESEKQVILEDNERLRQELREQTDSVTKQAERYEKALAVKESEKQVMLEDNERLRQELREQTDSAMKQAERYEKALALKEREWLEQVNQIELIHKEAREKDECAIRQYFDEINAAKAKIDELSASSHHWRTAADSLSKDLQVVYASRSWRITAPLRFIAHSIHWFWSRVWAWLTFKPNSRPRRVVKRIILRSVEVIETSPKLKQRIVSGAYRLGLYPVLRKSFHRVAKKNVSVQIEKDMNYAQSFTVNDECITPWTNQMLSRLKAAREGMNKEAKRCE